MIILAINYYSFVRGKLKYFRHQIWLFPFSLYAEFFSQRRPIQTKKWPRPPSLLKGRRFLKECFITVVIWTSCAKFFFSKIQLGNSGQKLGKYLNISNWAGTGEEFRPPKTLQTTVIICLYSYFWSTCIIVGSEKTISTDF